MEVQYNYFFWFRD